VLSRVRDLPGWTYPDWEQVEQSAGDYQPRTDVRLVVDTTRPIEDCDHEIAAYLAHSCPPGQTR
jgi:hypothetical protein